MVHCYLSFRRDFVRGFYPVALRKRSIRMNNITKATFQPFFESELQLLQNPICRQCDAEIRHPLLPWLVGPKFSESPYRVVFIGKPHRGIPGETLPSGIIDPTTLVANELWDWWPAYWSYTRAIAENLYGRNSHEFIAITNLIKCTNVDDGQITTDKTTYKMSESCILKLGVVWREIERLKARTVVFYTYGLFREMLQAVPVALDTSVQEITSQVHRAQCRDKRLGWWERACRTTWNDDLRILVVGHPERMARLEYVELLTNWIRSSSRDLRP